MEGKWGHGHFTWSQTGEDMWGHFIYVPVTDVHAHTHTDTDKERKSKSGIKVINDKQDKFSLQMTHDYTCLQSCATEVFTSPGARIS